jgi:hypothetical protein
MKLFSGNSTDIWFTLGPVSSSSEMIVKMLNAGAYGIRTTFSYGTHEIQEDISKRVSSILLLGVLKLASDIISLLYKLILCDSQLRCNNGFFYFEVC